MRAPSDKQRPAARQEKNWVFHFWCCFHLIIKGYCDSSIIYHGTFPVKFEKRMFRASNGSPILISICFGLKSEIYGTECKIFHRANQLQFLFIKNVNNEKMRGNHCISLDFCFKQIIHAWMQLSFYQFAVQFSGTKAHLETWFKISVNLCHRWVPHTHRTAFVPNSIN